MISIKSASDPVLSFLDELASNAQPERRKALNPIIIGGSAKLYAEGLRSALAQLDSADVRERIARIIDPEAFQESFACFDPQLRDRRRKVANRKARDILSTGLLPDASPARRVSDKQLWEAGCLTREQLGKWSDSDFVTHTSGIRKTLHFLFDLIDSQPDASPGNGGEKVREALAPFAKIADEYDDREDGDFQIWKDCDQSQTRVTLGMCRSARAALHSTSAAGETTGSDGQRENQPEKRTGPHRASGETNSGSTGDSELTRSAVCPSEAIPADVKPRKVLTLVDHTCDECSGAGSVDGKECVRCIGQGSYEVQIIADTQTWPNSPMPATVTPADVLAMKEALKPFAKMAGAMYVSGHCGGASPEDWPDRWVITIQGGIDFHTPQQHGGLLTVADFRRAAAAIDKLSPEVKESEAKYLSGWMTDQYKAGAKPPVGSPEVKAEGEQHVATVTYTNWRGETSVRRIIPKAVRYGVTAWHPQPQWLLLAWDDDKQADREFTLQDFGAKAEGGRGEPVQDTWFTDRLLPVVAISGDVESDLVLKLHFRRPVTDQDRIDLTDALNMKLRATKPSRRCP